MFNTKRVQHKKLIKQSTIKEVKKVKDNKYTIQNLPTAVSGYFLEVSVSTSHSSCETSRCSFSFFPPEELWLEVHISIFQVFSGQSYLWRVTGIDHSEDSHLLFLHAPLLFVWKYKQYFSSLVKQWKDHSQNHDQYR